MIQMAIVGDPNRVPQYLLDRIPKAIVGIEKAMARIVLKLQVKIQTEKLSGQVLNQRHGGGGLKQSIHSDVQTGGYSVIGRGFTNKEYAAIHEFGFDGEETVRAHTRRIAGQRFVLKSGKFSKKNWAVPKSQGATQVRSFTRHMHMPERSFMRSALREMGPEAYQELYNELDNVFK